MAKEKISELDAAGTLDGTELVPVVQGGDTVRTTTQNIANTKMLTGSAALNFGDTAAGASADLTIAVTGAVVGNVVALGVPHAATVANGVFTAWVSAADVVTVRFTNTNLVTSLNPASATFNVRVWQ